MNTSHYSIIHSGGTDLQTSYYTMDILLSVPRQEHGR